MAGAPKGNKNAEKHGFYSDVLTEEEAKLYDAAQHATLGDEVAIGRIKLNRLLLHMSDPANGEVSDGTKAHMDRMLGRIGDLEVKRSIIERNRIESGAGVDEALDRTIEVLERTGAHRATFKGNGKSNGKAGNGNGRD
ncbi:MAG: hypothetical protein ACR2RF_33155 [Geminicoccaceae bacterium]